MAKTKDACEWKENKSLKRMARNEADLVVTDIAISPLKPISSARVYKRREKITKSIEAKNNGNWLLKWFFVQNKIYFLQGNIVGAWVGVLWLCGAACIRRLGFAKYKMERFRVGNKKIRYIRWNCEVAARSLELPGHRQGRRKSGHSWCWNYVVGNAIEVEGDGAEGNGRGERGWDRDQI